MAWRFVVQPDGKFARFSDVVDDFTHFNLTREEAVNLYLELLRDQAEEKVMSAVRAGDRRWDEELATIKAVHGEGREHMVRHLYRIAVPKIE